MMIMGGGKQKNTTTTHHHILLAIITLLLHNIIEKGDEMKNGQLYKINYQVCPSLVPARLSHCQIRLRNPRCYYRRWKILLSTLFRVFVATAYLLALPYRRHF